MVQFCTQYSRFTAPSHEEFCRHQHSERRRREVNPDRCPVRCGKRRSESTSWIHTHPGNWRFDADVNHHQRRRNQPSVSIELRYVGHAKDDRHQEECNDNLRKEGPPVTVGPRQSHYIIHCRMSQPPAKHNVAGKNSKDCSYELSRNVEESIDGFDFPQP